jgi:hypothetical protein
MKNFLKQNSSTKKIEFCATGATLSDQRLELSQLDPPSPAKNFLPDWYKDATFFRTSNRFDPRKESFLPDLGFKSCISFFDGITLGYTITLWTDIWITVDPEEETKSKLSWTGTLAPVEVRDQNLNPTLPIPMGCADTHLAWRVPWAVKLPAGYSALYTHPINRFDLPFVTVTGVIDNDKFTSGGNFPVFIKKDFYGVIPAGTPIAQVFPFKREEWKAELNPNLYEESARSRQKARSTLHGWYKRNAWTRKAFN